MREVPGAVSVPVVRSLSMLDIVRSFIHVTETHLDGRSGDEVDMWQQRADG